MKMDKSTFDSHVRFFENGEVIFKENEPGNQMYLIIQGAVEIRKATGPASSKTLISLGKGDLFGEMAIIEKKPRSASAVAVEPTKLLGINEKLYESMIVSNPDFARKMSRVLSERIRKSNAIIQHIMSTNKQNQLWAGLMEYSREHGVSTFKGVRVIVTEFTHWAMEHLGMLEKDIEVILTALLKREFITYSAKGKEEIVVTPRVSGALPGG
jgi:CRP/FNR family transcriptional regulator, cyclic AMP receptor protein